MWIFCGFPNFPHLKPGLLHAAGSPFVDTNSTLINTEIRSVWMNFSLCPQFLVCVSDLIDWANSWILCREVFCENLVVAQLVKKLPEFYSAWKFIAISSPLILVLKQMNPVRILKILFYAQVSKNKYREMKKELNIFRWSSKGKRSCKNNLLYASQCENSERPL
jgi:hypothetical protein